jgi:hypothetical protein
MRAIKRALKREIRIKPFLVPSPLTLHNSEPPTTTTLSPPLHRLFYFNYKPDNEPIRSRLEEGGTCLSF